MKLHQEKTHAQRFYEKKLKTSIFLTFHYHSTKLTLKKNNRILKTKVMDLGINTILFLKT